MQDEYDEEERTAVHDKEAEFEEDMDEDINDNEAERFFINMSNSLKSQVHDELGITDDEEDSEEVNEDSKVNQGKKNLKIRIFKIIGIILGLLLLTGVFLIFTKPGQKILIRITAKIARSGFNDLSEDPEDEVYVPPTDVPLPTDAVEITPPVVVKAGEPRQEEYVINCLLVGVEEMFGARNTDSMMIASVNTKTKEISLLSLMRDTYVDIPGYRGNKLNAVYEKAKTREEGAQLLIDTVEKNFHIKIDAYASVNFDSMENVVNLLGGVTVELTQGEARYLQTTNYIADPNNRYVKSGVQTLNGGQVVGYCRVRLVPTLGGANDDYGRTLRQRRVLTAIFNKYKSKSIPDLISIGIKCLNMVRSNITEDQIVKVLTMVIDNKITEIKAGRFPFEGIYYDSARAGYNGITYALVIDDKEKATKELYKFIYGDTDEEAEVNYEIYKEIYED